MSPDGFDDVDRALAAGLSDLAPSAPNGDEVLESVRPRFRRARARSRVTRAGGAVVALLAVGSVATLAAPHSGRTHVTVGAGSTVPGSTRPVGSSTTTVSTSPPRPGVVHASTTTSSTVPAPNRGTGPGTVPSTTPPATTQRGGGPGPVPGHGESTSTIAPLPPEAQTYASTGGSILVRLVGGAASLAHVSPAAGCGYSVHDDGPGRVEVRFTRGGEEVARIDVQVESGHLVRVQHGG